MTPTLALKVLGPDRWSCHGGRGQWPEPGVWTRTITDPVPCVRGWHLCRETLNLLIWLGPEIWVAEWDGDCVDDADKIVVSRARLVRRTSWDERAARLLAADCAEHVLPLFEAAVPSDDRPRRAIDAARAHARGEISAAARDATRAAAMDAAMDAARAAAMDAARAAARAAAMDAAGAAKAAVKATTGDAAWAAAEAAAWAAADAAVKDTPRGAVWDAAGAAWDAAWAAERSWQAAQLADALGLTPDEAAVLAPALGEHQEVPA